MSIGGECQDAIPGDEAKIGLRWDVCRMELPSGHEKRMEYSIFGRSSGPFSRVFCSRNTWDGT